jgi:hypothetical protein
LPEQVNFHLNGGGVLFVVEQPPSWIIIGVQPLGTGASEDLKLIVYGIIHHKVCLVSHIDPFITEKCEK